ncbi:protein CURVATURE THYLAKOID 1A, chloroplastic-like [Tasmannia lanceolata]|uniref:protein CURVATURE THYLAKOID 1A, chloroplastic-like n=1 Tax=Tasmannia lanceolata TaxID=3420 RepID=UPI004063AA9A
MATAYSGASMAAVLGASLSSSSTRSRHSLLLPPRHSFSHTAFSTIAPSHLSESRRFSPLRTRATSSEETSISVQVEEIFSDLKEKWDGLENKSTVIIYGGGAIVAVWLSSIVVGAINSVPLLPKVMEIVGLGYTGWFVYRYLLFKSSRKELATDIEILKKKIAGTSEK